MHQLVKDVMLGGFVMAVAALTIYEVTIYPAHADEPIGPPPQGMTVIIKQPMLQCDTSEQIKQIAAAMLVSDKEAAAKIDEFHAIIDKEGEPSCVFGSMQMPATVGESVALPDLKFGDIEVNDWCVHLGTSRGEWYALYIKPKTPDKDNSI
jgi:hypothetical protein